jgi:hypothetical protein
MFNISYMKYSIFTASIIEQNILDILSVKWSWLKRMLKFQTFPHVHIALQIVSRGQDLL